MTLANIDPRILAALRAIRTGNFSYKKGLSVPPDLVTSLSADLGYPAAWGDPAQLPPFGGPSADAVWKVLGVPNRHGVGGLPCEVVHGGVTGNSCTANAGIRGLQAFAEAIALYLPVRAIVTLIKTRLLTSTQRSTFYLSYSLDLAGCSRFRSSFRPCRVLHVVLRSCRRSWRPFGMGSA